MKFFLSSALVSILCGLILLTLPDAKATTLAGLSYTGATNFKSFDLNGTLDLGKTETWEGILAYTYTDSTQGQVTDAQGGESKSNLFTGGIANTPDDFQKWEFDLNYWKDTINDLRYVGPKFSFGYTWLADEDDDVKPTLFAANVSLEADFYAATLERDPVTGKVTRKSRLAKATTQTLNFSQIHPTFEIEKPLFDEFVVPFAEYAHYFYSKKPDDIENSISKSSLHLSSSFVSGVNGAIGGFLTQSYSLGFTLNFQTATKLRLEYGRSQSATDDSWSPAYGATVTQSIGDHVEAKAGWSHSVQAGVSADYYTGALTYIF